jgi:hypothetical protein
LVYLSSYRPIFIISSKCLRLTSSNGGLSSSPVLRTFTICALCGVCCGSQDRLCLLCQKPEAHDCRKNWLKLLTIRVYRWCLHLSVLMVAYSERSFAERFGHIHPSSEYLKNIRGRVQRIWKVVNYLLAMKLTRRGV